MVIGLAVTFMLLTFGITIDSAFAQTINLVPADSIEDSDNTSHRLNGADGIASFTIGSSTYVVVTASDESSVQIIDVTNPSSITATDALRNPTQLDTPRSVTTFTIGTKTYVAVTAVHSDGVNIIDVSDTTNITLVNFIDDTDGTYELDGPSEITSFKIGTKTFVAVASSADDGVQILNVTTPTNITAADSIDDGDNTDYELASAAAITSFKIGTKTFVAVASTLDDGVQILEISSQGAITARGNIDDTDGTYELDGATGITSFKIGTKTFVAVASIFDDGVQILEISSQGDITTIDSIDDTDGTYELDGATGITSFKIGTKTFVAVASIFDDGVQILEISSQGAITAIDSIDDTDGTYELDGAKKITSFKIGSSTYVAVSANEDDGVQILKLNQPPTANAGSDKNAILDATVTLDGTGSRDPDGNSNLTYSWLQTPGTPTVAIDDSTSARTTFTAPSDPTKLVFTLTVSDEAISDTDDITITIAKPASRNIKDMGDTLVSAKITGPNEITMTYNEELSTFINSYLNFTITEETTPRNITGIDGSPSKETVARIDGQDTNVFVTTLTFDGEPVPAGSTGTMYMQHAEYYLELIHVSNGQN